MRQVSDNLTIILEEDELLTTLINDVLDISKMEARQVDWKFEPTSLHDVVATAVSSTASLFEDGPVERWYCPISMATSSGCPHCGARRSSSFPGRPIEAAATTCQVGRHCAKNSHHSASRSSPSHSS